MTIQTKTAFRKNNQKCPECKSKLLVKREDERCIVCTECGFVISNDTARLVKEENQSGEGERQLEPIILFSEKSTFNENNNDFDMKIVNTLENWKRVKTSDSGEKNLAIVLQQTTQIARDLSLPAAVLEKAVLIYKRVIEKNLTRGRSSKVMIATVIYLSCEQNHIGVTIKDLANLLRLSPKKIIRNCRLVTRELDFSTPILSVEDRLNEISKRIKLSNLTKENALKIVNVVEPIKSLIGKDPSAIACGALYLGAFLSKERVKQRTLSEVSRSNESTIRKRIRDLEKNLYFEIKV